MGRWHLQRFVCSEDVKLCSLVVIGVNEGGKKKFSDDRKWGSRVHLELTRGVAGHKGTWD